MSLSKEQELALDDMVKRRMVNTGETEQEAKDAVIAAIRKIHQDLAEGGSYQVFDEKTGRIIGERTSAGYREYD